MTIRGAEMRQASAALIAHQRAMAVTRQHPEQYRRLARECLAAARIVSTESLRDALNARAETLFRLEELDRPRGPATHGCNEQMFGAK